MCLVPDREVMWPISAFPQFPMCTERIAAIWGGALFASGIAMETATLFMESLDCFHSPAVYHSVHMLETNGAQEELGVI